MNDPEARPWFDTSRSDDERARLLVEAMTRAEKVAQCWHATPAVPRLGVPAYDWWNEALHGVARAGRATVFPQAIGLAATFDPDLVRRVAQAIATEGRAVHGAAARCGNRGPYVGLTYWSPTVNLYRDLRWGRGQETWGEDPYLTARMGVAFVRGLQGDDPHRLRAAACAKHFVAHSGPEAGRAAFDALVTERDLVESYLPAFEALIREGRVEGVMCAYNRLNGEPCCGSGLLVGDLLRRRLGFEGYVVTDCWAGEQLHTHHRLTGTLEEAVAQAVRAGVNVFCGTAAAALQEALDAGLLDEDDLDRALERSLRTRFRLGLFDGEAGDDATPPEVVGCGAHAELAREAAARSFVLLKNAGDVLPLAHDLRSVYVTGPCATSVEALLGTYHGVAGRLVTVLEGVAARSGVGTRLHYQKGCALDVARSNPIDWASQQAKEADVTIAVMGLTSELVGEEGDAVLSDHGGDWPSLRLPACQVDYLRALRAGHEKPIVLVLTTGVPLILDDVEDLVDAILLVWCPGEQGGHAVADVLFGDAEPGGRMPVTVPRSVDHLPAFTDYGMQGRTYRFQREAPLYAFASGRGYTSFAVRDVTVQPADVGTEESAFVEVVVENTGARSGAEVVPLFLTDPRDDPLRPYTRLVAFERATLEPGERQTVSFEVTPGMRTVVGDGGELLRPPGAWSVGVASAGEGPRGRFLLR